MTGKIFRSIVLASAVSLLAAFALVMGYMASCFGGAQENELQNELSVAAAAVEGAGSGWLDTAASDEYRLTLIAPDGTVLRDTASDAAEMENHAARSEVRQALETGTGSSVRYSSTMLEKTVYLARRLGSGEVLRISAKRSTVGVMVLGAVQPLLAVTAAALILSACLARRLSRKISEPLAGLDLDHPLEAKSYDELAPLLGRIESQRRQLSAQIDSLSEKNAELESITDSMNEGLVLLDERGRVVTINPAAREILSAPEDCLGRDFLTLDRSREISGAIEASRRDGRAEVIAERGGRRYQVNIKSIGSDAGTFETLLLAFDVTQRENAARARREFTANVSHELKTPLQSIIGRAELLEDGVVRPEDAQSFAACIRREARRLVDLVDDIIRLSRLDEGACPQPERQSLRELALEAAETLGAAASEGGVTLTVSGEDAEVMAPRGVPYNIIYNLCENAVKYNHPGGTAEIFTGREGTLAVLCVSDTGVGSAPEEQERVFERFYRVDKCRSGGGTGLGLSIVKHAVQLCGGRIELKSRPGEGTTVTVFLPAAPEA